MPGQAFVTIGDGPVLTIAGKFAALAPAITLVPPPGSVIPPASASGAHAPHRTPESFGLCGEVIAAGMPVTHSRAAGTLLCARADTHALAFLAGLAATNGLPSSPLEAVRSSLTLVDWSAVAGTPALVVGQPYFLAPTGGITLTPPAKPDSVCNVRVGEALTPQTLVFGYSAPILL